MRNQNILAKVKETERTKSNKIESGELNIKHSDDLIISEKNIN